MHLLVLIAITAGAGVVAAAAALAGKPKEELVPIKVRATRRPD